MREKITVSTNNNYYNKANDAPWWKLLEDSLRLLDIETIDVYNFHGLNWTAFNDHQLELGGDPFVGAKLGNLLQRVGFVDIATEVRTVHLDNRWPAERAEFIEFWTDLLLSGCDALSAAGDVTPETVAGMQAELEDVAHDPDAVFFYSFVQARARTQ